VKRSPLDTLLPVLVVAVALATGYLELRPWLAAPDTVLVSLAPPRQDGAAGAAGTAELHPLDRVLLDQRSFFEYDTSLNQALNRADEGTEIGILWADACEVSQGAFRRFAQWLDFQPPEFRRALLLPGQPGGWKYDSDTRRHRISGRLNAPASGVSYYDAHAYCRAAGGRLPTAGEWHALAAGQEGRLYPWGDAFDDGPWPYLDPLLNSAQPCGLHSRTDTPEGAHDLGNGVSEWSSGRDGEPTIHGGNGWDRPYALHSLSLAYRAAAPRHRSAHLGFRCFYDDAPAATPWRMAPRVLQLTPGRYPPAVPREARVPRLLTYLPPEDLSLLPVMVRDRQQTPRRLAVMRHEVTREEYARFLRDPLVHWRLYADPEEPLDHDYTPLNWRRQLRRPRRPVTGVDWWSAHAFARWAGGRLPLAREWVMVAAGERGSVLPWGDRYADGRAVTFEAGRTRPQRVGAAPRDRTDSGVMDMAGNVSEWTASYRIGAQGYSMVTKGGNFILPGKETARVSFANEAPPGYRSPALGFRVVFDR